jgi:hypothetical protein
LHGHCGLDLLLHRSGKIFWLFFNQLKLNLLHLVDGLALYVHGRYSRLSCCPYRAVRYMEQGEQVGLHWRFYCRFLRWPCCLASYYEHFEPWQNWCRCESQALMSRILVLLNRYCL